MNFKEKLAYVPLPIGSHCYPSIEHISSLGQDFLGNDLCLNSSKSTCTLNDDNDAESNPKADASRVPPTLRPSRASQNVSVFNVDAVIREANKSGPRMIGQVILDKVFRIPFERLLYRKGEFNSLYNLINERGVNLSSYEVTPSLTPRRINLSFAQKQVINNIQSSRLQAKSKDPSH
ncbi:hypothetical protein Cgig2_016470 [Carnegiea gigantea]|uniref:Uncharacterized protein n=1 Tax=Carnegiea gigantea TaxID=171969 RepID=A0A9Q1KQA3_9CARY|nr:hypothetical protein Cgig2_016470 [Carnegiea gigantea]